MDEDEEKEKKQKDKEEERKMKEEEKEAPDVIMEMIIDQEGKENKEENKRNFSCDCLLASYS